MLNEEKSASGGEEQNKESTPEVTEIIPPTPIPDKPKLSKIKFLILGICAALVLVSFVGAYFLGRNNSNQQVACTQEAKICPDGSAVGRTGPKCEFAKCPTPTQASDETVSWQKYTVEEISLEYKLPPDFPKLNKTVAPGQTGTQIYISASNTKQYVGPITLGTTSFDYVQGRGGQFVDLQGYVKQGSVYSAKFVSGKRFEIPQGLTTEITNQNGVKILKVIGKNFDESDPQGLPEAGTPGQGNIGALINTSDSYYTGFAVDMELSDEHTKELFDRIISTFKFTK